MNFVKLPKTWWLTLLFAYLLSALWLGGFIVCVPMVIPMAPMGLIALFQGPKSDAAMGSPGGVTHALISLHVLFWSIFFVGSFGCKKLPMRVIVALYGAVVVLLLLTLGGCARYYHWAGQNIN